MKKQRKKDGFSIRTATLLSYGLLLLLSLLIMSGIIWFSNGQLQKDRHIYVQSIALSCREKFDANIINAEKLINQLVYSESVQTLARGSASDTSHVYYGMYSECSTLYRLYGMFVSDFYVYASETDRVFSVSGVSSSQQLFSKENESFTRWYLQYFRDTLCTPLDETVRMPRLAPDGDGLCLLVSGRVPVISTGHQFLNVSMVIPLSEFVTSESYSVGLYSPEEDRYYLPGVSEQDNAALAGKLDQSNAAAAKDAAVEWAGGTAYLIPSRYFGFSYVVLLPEGPFDTAISSFMIRLIISVSVFLCIAFLAAYLLIRFVYRSSTSLMSRIFSDDGTMIDVGSNNEFEILDAYIHKKAAQYDVRLKYSAEYSRDYLISCLLHGRDIRRFENAMYDWETLLGFPFWTAEFIAVRIIPAVNPLANSIAPALREVQDTVQPVLGDLFADDYHIFFCEADSSIACLLSPRKPMDSADFPFDVKTRLDYFFTSPDGKIFPLVVIIGSGAKNSLAIHKSWQDTIYMMELLPETPGVFMFSSPIDINYTPTVIDRREDLHRLTLLLCAAEPQLAIEVITRLLTQAVEQESPNFVLRVLFYDILQSLIEAAQQELVELGAVEQFVQNNLPVYMFRRDFNEMLSFLCNLCYLISAQISERHAQRSAEPIKQVNAVKQYVLDHLQEDSLCVSSIAAFFSLSPPALSKLFTNVTGGGLHSFINKQRIERAKRLITTEPGLTIAQVAEQCGFSSMRTFLRVFSIETGMPPGKYRNSIDP